MAHSKNSDDSDASLLSGSGEKQKMDKPYSSRIQRTTSKIQCFVGVISMYVLTYLTMEMYLVAIITTLEKRFGLKSSQSGLLLSLREGASLSTAMLFSHLARNINKPKFLSVMGLIGCIGGFLCAVPHFIDHRPTEFEITHTQDNSLNPLCISENNSTVCDSTNNNNGQNTAYIFLALGSVLMGLTSSAHGSLSNTYVDDNSPPEKSAFYLGVINTMKPFGPMLGFMMGSLFLSIPENIQAWEGNIGAWWLGYIVTPLLYLIPSICLFFFPKYSRGVKKNPKKKLSEKHKSAFLPSLKRLLINPPYMLCIAGSCFSAFILSGMFPFMPKYAETQFGVSKAVSNMITGMGGTMVAGIGIFIGGFISSKFALGPSKSAILLFLSNLVFSISMLLNMAFGCPTEEVIGLNSNKNISCTPVCQCSPDVFQPVCHISTIASPDFVTSDYGTFHRMTSDNVTLNHVTSSHVTLASACYAGCMSEYSNKTYTNCNCAGPTQVIAGMCPSNCSYLIPYIVNLGIGALFVMIGTIPGLTVMLRIVKKEDKTLALGIVSTLVIMCSFIPGPVLYGTLIDGACLKWSHTCEGEGSCLFYDNDKFRLRLHGFTAAFKFIATFIYGIVAYLLRGDKYVVVHEHSEEKIGEKEMQISEILTAV